MGGKYKDTLCWHCNRSAAPKDVQCCWEASFTPVEGWTAEKRRVWYGNYQAESYMVVDCPLFIPLPPEREKTDTGRPPKFDLKLFFKLYDKGLLDREMAKAMGCCISSIANYRRRLGLKGNGSKRRKAE